VKLRSTARKNNSAENLVVKRINGRGHRYWSAEKEGITRIQVEGAEGKVGATVGLT